MYADTGRKGRRGRSARDADGAPGARPRGRRAAGRLFNQGDLRLIALRLISEKPRHGYELIKAVEEATVGVYRPSAGVVYPTLNYLEDLGYVTVRTDSDNRKIHEITAEGKSFLQSSAAMLEAIDARLGGMRKFSADEQTQPIRKAMDKLKASLKSRLSAGTLTDEDIDSIAAHIETAAVAIEQILTNAKHTPGGNHE